VEAPAPGPSADDEDEERTARLLRRRRCLPGGFLIAVSPETEVVFVLPRRGLLGCTARYPQPTRNGMDN
jgi:hypothetical protein